MILFDFSVLWAAMAYSLVGTLGFVVAAIIWFLRTSDEPEIPTHSSDNLDAALSRL